MFDESALLEKIMNADQNHPLHIYKNNIIAARISALTDLYKNIVTFLGEDFFHSAARHYAQTYHGTDSNLNLYGENFGLFLKSLPQCDPFPYLNDLCLFEYQMRRLSIISSENHITMQEIAAGAEIKHILKASYMMISEYDILSLNHFISGIVEQPNLEKSLYYYFLYRCPETFNMYHVPATQEQAEIFPALYSIGISAIDDTMLQNKNISDFVTFLMQKHLFTK